MQPLPGRRLILITITPKGKNQTSGHKGKKSPEKLKGVGKGSNKKELVSESQSDMLQSTCFTAHNCTYE